MKRNALFTLVLLFAGLLFGTQAMAQGRIDLNAAKATQECKNVTLDGFSASFSFSSIESQEINTEKGVFSIPTLPTTALQNSILINLR